MMLTGPSVHTWHEAVDWSQVAGAGHRLGWCPATSGAVLTEPSFDANWDGMARAGLVRGAVHRLSTVSAGRLQARHFVDAVDTPGSWLAALAVQPDGHRLDHRLPTIAQVVDFADEFHRLTGGHPLLIRTRWRWWAGRDPNGRGHSISPWLWSYDTIWAWRHASGDPPPDEPLWAPYGGWIVPTLWSLAHRRCPGIAGGCTITVFTGADRSLEELAGGVPAHGQSWRAAQALPSSTTARLRLRRFVAGLRRSWVKH